MKKIDWEKAGIVFFVAAFGFLFGVLACQVARADEITFTCIREGDRANLTSSPAGMAASCQTIMVSDTAKGLEFPLHETMSASTGAGAISVTAASYSATFAQGGSISVGSVLSGAPMFHGSTLLSNFSDDTGSFAGEFNVTHVDAGVLAEFGLGPKWNPDGSAAFSFGQSDVHGDDLSAVVGGGSVTIQTPAVEPVSEPLTLLLLGTGGLLMIYQVRRSST